MRKIFYYIYTDIHLYFFSSFIPEVSGVISLQPNEISFACLWRSLLATNPVFALEKWLSVTFIPQKYFY